MDALLCAGPAAQVNFHPACRLSAVWLQGRAQPFAATGIIATASSSGPGACAGSQPSGGTTSLRITIRAPRVFSCGGSLHTPALLLRSGVTCQGNVGRNLRLHPACGVLSSFPGGVQGGTRDVECYKVGATWL